MKWPYNDQNKQTCMITAWYLLCALTTTAVIVVCFPASNFFPTRDDGSVTDSWQDVDLICLCIWGLHSFFIWFHLPHTPTLKATQSWRLQDHSLRTCAIEKCTVSRLLWWIFKHRDMTLHRIWHVIWHFNRTMHIHICSFLLKCWTIHVKYYSYHLL